MRRETKCALVAVAVTVATGITATTAFSKPAAMTTTTTTVKSQGDKKRTQPPFLLATTTTTTSSLTADSSEWERMPMPARANADGHAVFGTLHGETLIERYDVWKRNGDAPTDDDDDDDTIIITSHVTLGTHLNGHPDFVHGGILGLVVDDLCGFAYESLHVRHAVTANLNVDYRAGVPAGTSLRGNVRLSRREGRKLYFTCQLIGLEDPTVLFVEATALYVIPRQFSEQERQDASATMRRREK
jgi:acyl-coenzyme A thioesterase PaaI-like protein